MPTKVVTNSVAWTVGGILIFCGGVLAGSAILKFKDVGTTVRPDRAASTLVIGGPYNMTRNPMYLGMAVFYFGIAVLDQWIWALILLPVVLTVIQRRAIEPEEALLERRFGANYISYKEDGQALAITWRATLFAANHATESHTGNHFLSSLCRHSKHSTSVG
jgi:protein-S-isoprenylcysteine O-methyltransferase Ste14